MPPERARRRFRWAWQATALRCCQSSTSWGRRLGGTTATSVDWGQRQPRCLPPAALAPPEEEVRRDAEGHMVMPAAPGAHLVVAPPQVLEAAFAGPAHRRSGGPRSPGARRRGRCSRASVRRSPDCAAGAARPPAPAGRPARRPPAGRRSRPRWGLCCPHELRRPLRRGQRRGQRQYEASRSRSAGAPGPTAPAPPWPAAPARPAFVRHLGEIPHPQPGDLVEQRRRPVDQRQRSVPACRIAWIMTPPSCAVGLGTPPPVARRRGRRPRPGAGRGGDPAACSRAGWHSRRRPGSWPACPVRRSTAA